MSTTRVFVLCIYIFFIYHIAKFLAIHSPNVYMILFKCIYKIIEAEQFNTFW